VATATWCMLACECQQSGSCRMPIQCIWGQCRLAPTHLQCDLHICTSLKLQFYICSSRVSSLSYSGFCGCSCVVLPLLPTSQDIPTMCEGGKRLVVAPPGPMQASGCVNTVSSRSNIVFCCWCLCCRTFLPLLPISQDIPAMREGGKRLVVAPPGPMQRQGVKSLTWVTGLLDAIDEAGGELGLRKHLGFLAVESS
jgi:hypothetical protein